VLEHSFSEDCYFKGEGEKRKEKGGKILTMTVYLPYKQKKNKTGSIDLYFQP